MRCPACDDEQLSKHGACRACGGIWLSEELVRERLSRAPMFTGGAYSERHCPQCDETMDEPLLFDVPIDRCPGHGMWFDKTELDEVLARANLGGWKSSPRPKPEDSLRMLIAAVGAWDRPKHSGDS